MHGTAGFRFREDEVEQLRILLGDFGLLERPGQQSLLLLRLKAAGMVEEAPEIEGFGFRSYFLTAEAKETIRKALG